MTDSTTPPDDSDKTSDSKAASRSVKNVGQGKGLGTGPGTSGEPKSGRRPSSPFGDVAPAALAALAFTVVAMAWLVAGTWLPGGRWLAVHLFTLGVLTNVVLAFSRHFGDTLTRSPSDGQSRWVLVTFNLAAATVMIGAVGSWPAIVGIGSTAATVAIFANYRELRRARKAAVGARFSWIVRAYERAHGAFIHGAILGGLMGAGVLSGTWYASARLAHLHVNILGWAGITLIATMVFFGPTMARTRIEPGADERAARKIRLGAHGVTVGMFLLLATGVGGTAGVVFRVLAAGSLSVFAVAVTSTGRAIAQAVRTAKPGMARLPVIAVCSWFAVIMWIDVVVVATASWRLLDAIGLAMLVAVLAQAVTTSLMYVAPMLMARTRDEREPLRLALERGTTPRTATFNLGCALVVTMALVGASAGTPGALTAAVGWTLVIGALAQPVLALLLVRAAHTPVLDE